MNEPVELICPECGDLIKIQDIRSLLLALHMMNSCTVRVLLTSDEER
jgi:hypothetical protein